MIILYHILNRLAPTLYLIVLYCIVLCCITFHHSISGPGRQNNLKVTHVVVDREWVVPGVRLRNGSCDLRAGTQRCDAREMAAK